MESARAPTVFVSFRNGDEPYAAALIYRALSDRFGAAAVFRSSESIRPGERFAPEIIDAVRNCSVLLAVIGPRWLTITDAHGRRLLSRGADWVRREIALALENGKVVIPVLLGDVPRLTKKDLPRSISGLAEWQTVRLDHRGSSSALERLIREILARVPAIAEPGARATVAGVERPAGARTRGWLSTWNVQPRINDFVGRDDVLAAVREHLRRAASGRVVLHGRPCTGKTQLATEYAFRFAGDYEAVWWFSGSASRLVAEFADLADAVGIEARGDAAAVRGALFTELDRRGRWLLIFDDVDDPGMLAPLLPASASGHVLFTSRNPSWGQMAAPIEVAEFRRAESIELLGRQLGGVGRGDADRLAEALGDLPLGVAQAAVFLRHSPMTASQYVELLETRTRELLDMGSPYTYPLSLAATWSLGLDALLGASAAASELVELCGFFAPTPIPLDVFASGARAEPTALARAAADPIRFHDAVDAAARSGLVTVAMHQIQLNRLFQAFIRDRIGHATATGLRELARSALAGVEAGDPRDTASWPRYGLVLPHVDALDLRESADPACQRLLLDTAHYLVVRGDPLAAYDLAGAALERWRDLFGEGAEPVLAAKSHVAQALYHLGRHQPASYRLALRLDEEVLRHRRLAGGEDDPRTLLAEHNVAVDRWAVDRSGALGPDQAERTRLLLESVVADRRRVLGDDHPDTLRSIHNLAIHLRVAGRVDEALALDKRNVEDMRRVLGEDHLDTLRSAHSLAADLRASGAAEAALTLDEDNFARLRRVLGEEHVDTLRSAHNVALGLRTTGAADRALALDEATWERRARVLGEEHVDTLRSAHSIALDLRALGETARAARLERATLARLEGAVRRMDPLDG